MSQQFFNGAVIDPKFVIERFRDLLKLLPKEPKIPIPPTKRPPVKIPKLPKPEAQEAGKGKKKATKKKITLKGCGRNWTKADLEAKLGELGYNYDEINEFLDKLYKEGKRISKPQNEEHAVNNIIKRFKELMGHEEPEWEEKKEEKDQVEHKEAIERKVKETEATKATQLIRSKASRLSAILKDRFNFKATTKLPKGLEHDFMSVFPDEEEEIISDYANELEAIKVKNDKEDADGKIKKALDADELTDKMLKLANKRIKLKKQLETKTEALVAGPEIIAKIKANPRRKVKISGPGRGKKGKGKQKTNNIETIQLVI